MYSALRLLSTTFMHHPKSFIQPKRTAFVLKRKNKIRLNELGSVFPKRLKKQSFYYDLVENTDYKKKPPIEIVLTKDVAGVGMKGEKIEMDVYEAYTELLLPKLAVYADSPEAQSLLMVKDEKHYSSIYSKIVENYLAGQAVEIILSNDTPWTLQPWHVRLALRKNGILTNEDCISIPKEISGPKFEIENKDFIVYITNNTSIDEAMILYFGHHGCKQFISGKPIRFEYKAWMNKSETFPIRCRIYHWSSSQPSLNQKSFDIHSVSEPLFHDEKEKIESLIKVGQEIRRNFLNKKFRND